MTAKALAPPGEVIGSRFLLESVAGEGAMGVVYRAVDKATGARVAVKLIAGDRAELASRFDRESRVLASLSHPHIVSYVAHGTDAKWGAFLAMEWLEGENLAARLERGRLGLVEAFEVTLAMASALTVAHDNGVIHRDLKPSNVFLVGGRCEALKVLDFGIARRAAGTQQTKPGSMLGTVGFMAPEQVRGEEGVGFTADVFGLGAVMYFAFTGSAPFQGSDPLSILMRLVSRRVRSPRALRPSLPEPVERLMLSMLRMAPHERPSDARDVARQLIPLRADIERAARLPDPIPDPGAPIPEVALGDSTEAAHMDTVAAVTRVGPAAGPSGASRAGSVNEAPRRAPRPRIVVAAAVAAIVTLAGAAFIVSTRLANPKRASSSATAAPSSSAPAPPCGGAVCAPIVAPNLEAMDLADLAQQMDDAAASYDPRAVRRELIARRTSRGLVDVTTRFGVYAMYARREGSDLVEIMVTGQYGSLEVSRPFKTPLETGHTAPGLAGRPCRSKLAYEAAVAAGLAAGYSGPISLAAENPREGTGRLLWWLGEVSAAGTPRVLASDCTSLPK